MANVFYSREKGPQCATARIFVPLDLTRRTVDQLLTSELYWYWQSVREGPSLSKEPFLPDRRVLTLLHTNTAPQLEAEVEEIIQDGTDFEYRSLDLFGLESVLPEPLNEKLDTEVGQFISEESGRLKAAIVRFRDIRDCYIYFPHHLSPAIERLFQQWQLDPRAIDTVRPYKSLHLAQLEQVMEALKYHWSLKSENNSASDPSQHR